MENRVDYYYEPYREDREIKVRCFGLIWYSDFAKRPMSLFDPPLCESLDHVIARNNLVITIVLEGGRAFFHVPFEVVYATANGVGGLYLLPDR